jgi:hypothetical protein
MEVSGRLHTPAALTPEKGAPLPTEQEAGWGPLQVPTLVYNKEKYITLVVKSNPVRAT